MRGAYARVHPSWYPVLQGYLKVRRAAGASSRSLSSLPSATDGPRETLRVEIGGPDPEPIWTGVSTRAFRLASCCADIEKMEA